MSDDKKSWWDIERESLRAEDFADTSDKASEREFDFFAIGKYLDGFAACNLAEPSPGDLERVYEDYSRAWRELVDLRESHADLLKRAEVLVEALESEPIEVVGRTKDGRPLHQWTRHVRVEKALSALAQVIKGARP